MVCVILHATAGTESREKNKRTGTGWVLNLPQCLIWEGNPDPAATHPHAMHMVGGVVMPPWHGMHRHVSIQHQELLSPQKAQRGSWQWQQ